jgi:hydrogenase nickel incorporation protein HypA/HybF
MHELSLAEQILALVEQAAQREGFSRVALLRLQAGALAGVEVPALRFALEALQPGSVLAEARIEIETPPGRAWCGACRMDVEISSRLDPCPRCGHLQLRINAGTELRVLDLLVNDTLPPG